MKINNVRKYSNNLIPDLRFEQDVCIRYQPEAIVVPTPFKLLSAVIASPKFGNFLKAFLVSAITARGVFTFIK